LASHVAWPELYDEMCAVAGRGLFRGFGSDDLAAHGIGLEWMRYDYPEYPQLYPPFDPHVTVLDLLFMTGDAARDYLRPARVDGVGSIR